MSNAKPSEKIAKPPEPDFDAVTVRRELRIFTPAELAAALEVDETALTRWRAGARPADPGMGPPFTRLGRRIFYRYDDVCDWIQSRVMKPKFDEPEDGEVVETREARLAMVLEKVDQYLAGTVVECPHCKGDVDLEHLDIRKDIQEMLG